MQIALIVGILPDAGAASGQFASARKAAAANNL